MPGSALPSRYSRLAPPPVEMWPNAVVVEAELAHRGGGVAAADDGQPVDLGERLRRRPWCRRRTARSRRRPSGRSRTPSWRRRARRRTPSPTRARCRGRAGRRGSRRRRTTVARRRPSPTELRGDHDVGRQHAARRRTRRRAARYSWHGVDLVLLEQALADLVALGDQEREDHPAADQQLVGLAEQVVDHAELVGDLRAAEHHHVRALGVLGEPAQHVDLGRHQAARRVRQPLRDVVHAGLLAVHDAEAVADEHVGRARRAGRRRRRARRRPCWSRRRRTGRSPAPRPRRRRAPATVCLRALARRCRSRTRPAVPSSSPSRSATGASEYAVLGRALRAAEVRHHDDPRAGSRSCLDRRHAGPDPAVVGDPWSPSSGTLRSERTRTRLPRSPPSVGEVSMLRPSASERAADVARPGRRGGWSSPTRCRTSRRP